jgi:psiF repeat
MKCIVTAALVCFAFNIGAALAQNPPQPTPAPAATPAPITTGQPPSQPTAADKKAIAKACSDQATAKGLHGKERRKFRAACRKNGGNPPT